MPRLAPAALLTALATAAAAQSAPSDYLDDRSSPELLVKSLYNAIDRHEYPRAWSYFAEGAAAPYATFRDGYADTASVEIRLGEVTAEGAAGTVHAAVPVVLRATGTHGGASVYAGCYRTVQVQPGAQDTPPFRPIEIDRGHLAKTSDAFASAVGTCADPT